MIERGTFRHFKGKKYRVLGTATHSETMDLLVVYEPLYESEIKLFVRPLSMFADYVEVQDGDKTKKVPRFNRLSQGRFKGKGSSFERDTCARLSLWVSKGARNDLFCRTVSSGAQATQSLKQGKQRGNPGDIACNDPLGHEFTKKILVECKHWEDLDIIALINEKGTLYDEIIKTKTQAEKLEKDWCFVAKQDYKPTLFIVDARFGMWIHNQVPSIHTSVINYGTWQLMLFSFDEILKNLTHEQIIKCCINPITTFHFKNVGEANVT